MSAPTCRRNSSAMTCKLWWRRWRSAWASINQTFASWSTLIFRAISNPIIRKPVAPGVMACLRKRCCFTIRLIWRGLRRCLEEKPQGQLQDIERHKLNAMGAFAEAQTCRRLVLLNYFLAKGGRSLRELRYSPRSAETIRWFNRCSDCPFSTIGRVNQRFGMGYVVEVIRGANNQRIRDYGHDKLKVSWHGP